MKDSTRCDLCGKEVQAIVRCLIEGSEMKVCEPCARFGKALSKPISKREADDRLKVLEKKRPEVVEVLRMIVPDYARKIKAARERLGLTQDEFAKRLAERASTLHQMESGHLKPSIELAQKIERVIGVKLVEEIKDDLPSNVEPATQGAQGHKRASNSFVLGDFIKRR